MFKTAKFEQAKDILEANEKIKRKLRSCSVSHGEWNRWEGSPSNTEMHLGIEIECIFPSIIDHDLAMSELGAYKKYISDGCDGSIEEDNDNDFTCEIKVCFPVTKPYILKNILEIMNAHGSRVNSSCGLHVHLDMRGKKEDEFVTIVTNLQNVMESFKEILPAHRHDNSYCEFIEDDTSNIIATYKCANDIEWNNLNAPICDDKYRAVNVSSYDEYQTIEVRCHSGSTNFKKIWNWCKFLVLLTKVDTVLKPADKLEKVYEQVKLPPTLKTYLNKRREVLHER